MAAQFNEFFTNIAKKTVATINPSSKDPSSLIPQNLNKFKLNDKNLTEEEILEATKLLANKKKPGPYRTTRPYCIPTTIF